jgi:hypothetical protein
MVVEKKVVPVLAALYVISRPLPTKYYCNVPALF